jgi:hypothetical protein
MSQWVLDASLALQWFLEDESERSYPLLTAGRQENQSRIQWFSRRANICQTSRKLTLTTQFLWRESH